MSMDFLSNSPDIDFYGIGGVSKFMTEDDALKLADVMSVVNAACCIVGVAPSLAQYFNGPNQFTLNANDSDTNLRLPESQARIVATAICNAITGEKLKAAHIERPNVHGISDSLLDIWDTLIDVEELKRWLITRNCKPPFFFGADASNTPDYLEAKHPSFSPEIAAAIRAWEAIQDPELRKGKTVKAAATEWLETNYRELDLMHNGKRSNEAIKRIATLVNWESSGGAPKTPG